MAANRSSRPKRNSSNMLIGLENLIEKPISNLPEEDIVESNNTVPSINETTATKEVPKEKPVAVVVPELPKANLDTQKAKKFGRPRKFLEGEDTKVIGVKLRMNEVTFLEEYGGKYGGKTGYVTYLIRKEMERMGVDF